MRSLRARARVAWDLLRDRYLLNVPPGDAQSPIPSRADVVRAEDLSAEIRAAQSPPALAGINLRGSEQIALLASLQPFYDELPFDDGRPTRFHYDNTWFPHGDAVAYALMLRHLRPRRVIEAGCGHSSALALDIDDLFLGGGTEFTFIDPDPARLRSLLTEGDLVGRLIEGPVQDVPLAAFEALESGDILFIDSSHVLKAGSDLQFLLNDVLPALAAGVHIHIHDVFYPFEYPDSWLDTGVAVNEAYAIRALLQFSDAYEVVLFTSYLADVQRPWLAEHMPLMLASAFPAGSIWLRRTAKTMDS